MQIQNSFDPETIKKIGKGALIAGGATALTYALEYLSNMNFGQFQPLAVMLISISINSVREYQKGIEI